MPEVIDVPHRVLTTAQGIHYLQAWEVADDAARDAIAYDAANVGKVCRVTGTGRFYLLTASEGGPAWERLTVTLSDSEPAQAAALETGAAGVSTEQARADHVHKVATAAPAGGLGAGNAEGVSTSLARADHQHDASAITNAIAAKPSLTTDAPNSVRAVLLVSGSEGQPDTFQYINDAGDSPLAARADHTHEAATGTPVAVGTAGNSEGDSELLARADHVHDGSAFALKMPAIRYLGMGATVDTVQLADLGGYVFAENADPMTVTIPFLAVNPGFSVAYFPRGPGQVSFVGAGTETVRVPPGYVAKSRGQYCEPIVLVKVGVGEWQLFGGLAVY